MAATGKFIIACTHCQSINVLKDAYASWDIDSQQWVLDSTYDENTCSDCGEETRGQEIAIPPCLIEKGDEDEIQDYVRMIMATEEDE